MNARRPLRRLDRSRSAFASLLAGLLLAAPLAAHEAERPDLSGHWVLDRDSRPAGEPGAPAPDEARNGDRPSQRGPGRRPTGAGEGDPIGLREEMAARERAAAELDLRAVDGGFLLRDGAGREWPLRPGPLEESVPGPDGVDTYVRSEWQEDGSLRVWKVHVALPTVVETYRLDAVRDRLSVEVVFSGGRGGRNLRRDYRRASDVQAAPTPSAP